MKLKKIIKIIISVVGIGIGIGLPPALIVHCNADKTVSEITADGMLGYIGSILSSVATICLTLYALYQTNHANKIAGDAYEIEKYNYQLQIRPFITVTDYEIATFSQDEILNPDKIVFYKVGKCDSISPTNGIKFRITNTTDAFLTFAYDGANCEEDNSIRWEIQTDGYNNCKIRNINLMAGESKEIVFIVDEKMLTNLEGKTLTMSFILGNRFTEKYEEKFEIWFVHMLKNNSSIKYLLRFQNFQIEPNDSDKEEI